MFKELKIKKKSIYAVLFIIVFKFILEYGYISFVNPLYEYSGFSLNISSIKIIESYLLVIVISTILVQFDKYDKPSKVVIYILFINLYLPLSSLYWLQDNSRPFYLLISISIISLCLFLMKVKVIRIQSLREGNNITFLLLIGITIIVYGYLLITGGIQRVNFNLMDVYGVREDYSLISNRLFGYLVPWQANIINLFFLIYGIIKRSKNIIFVSVFLQLFLFSMTNFKSFLFSPLVVLGIYMIFKKGLKNNLLLTITIILSLFSSLLLIFSKITGDIILLSIFLRRLFFVPAKLHFQYFDFMENMEKYKLSHSILSGFVTNPYGIGPVELVSNNLFENGGNPNVGVFGDSFVNFGFAGVLLFTMILGFILLVLDSVASNSPSILSMSIIIIPSMSLINSALFTSLATHGILFSILIIWLTSSLFRIDERNKLY